MPIQILKDLDIQGKRVLIREDLNVPLKDGKITSDARIRAALPTLQYAVSQGAKVIVMSHLGRPLEGVAIVDQPDLAHRNASLVCHSLLKDWNGLFFVNIAKLDGRLVCHAKFPHKNVHFD